MFTDAQRDAAGWCLTNRWGHELRLPSLVALHGRPTRFATLGTRFQAKPRKVLGSNKTEIMARLLRSLACPIFVIDTRRDGVGAQSSWSPREWASQVPDLLGDAQPYDYMHLPILAPSIDLLQAYRGHQLGGWQVFRDGYDAGLATAGVRVAQAFVEAAVQRGGLAVLLCAEPYCARFDEMAQDLQDTLCCHRFHLARRVALALQREHPGMAVDRVDLDADAFAAAVLAGRDYEPATRRLEPAAVDMPQ
ncbi:MAG: hypothetical protein A3E25_20920 [Burkholderiales bacterium RIFCSPHIGHO2_12_FULL_69_20]|nr:MAG: hypothetical protein A3E25_20920 [Burkholderiales bacterium RIFCSPHIGHO2_12_FULL_69_20]